MERVPQLIRQRTRWVQGYFQCWKRIPSILLLKGHWYTVVDLLYTIIWPAVSCLLLPVAIMLSWFVVGYNVAHAELSGMAWITVRLIAYLLAFGTSIILGLQYRARSGDISILRTIGLIHTIWLFQFVWAAAAWRGLGRIVRRQGSWAKTARTVVVSPALP